MARFPLRTAAAAAVLLAAACTDDGVSPPAAVDAAGPAAHHAPTHLQRGKYRDSSAPHATGRSGSAVLAGRAVVLADGSTRLVLSTGGLDDRDARGELAKVQVKAFAADGTQLFVQNHQRPSRTGWAELRLAGLAPGAVLRVQANVRGIDRRRTDVVTLTETVKLAASLQARVNPPADVVAGVPATVTATVTETGGDTGAWTSCVLYVDGVEVDRADSVWVDAGDQVTCAFTYQFPRSGEYDVRVGLESGSDLASLAPAPPVTVDVTDPTPVPAWRFSVDDRVEEVTTRYDYGWSMANGSHMRYESSETNATRAQTVSLTGTLARATAFPMDAELSISSDAAAWQSDAFSGLAGTTDASGASCADQWIAAHGGHLTLCSTGTGASGTTVFGYTRFAGTVTYHSDGFSRRWDNVAGQETYWTWNDTWETQNGGGQAKPVGTALTLRLRVTDGAGAWTVDATAPLSAYDETTTVQPYTCTIESPYWLEGGELEQCRSHVERIRGARGEASG